MRREGSGSTTFTELENILVAETQEELLSEELLSVLFQLEIFEAIPGIGAISGGLLNLAFMRRVDNTARRVFQEALAEGQRQGSVDRGGTRALARPDRRVGRGTWPGGLFRVLYGRIRSGFAGMLGGITVRARG